MGIPHGGYRNLKAYQVSEIIYDGTVAFCRRFIDPRSRTTDQMIQAARSGKQNIAEGSMASATSKTTEIRLTGVARASLEEVLLDLEDYIRQNGLSVWEPDSRKALFIRELGKTPQATYSAYRIYIEEKSAETAANTLICLLHQANHLLDRLIEAQRRAFIEVGGSTEDLYAARLAHRRKK